MATEGTVKAILLDGMGTLLRLVPPAPALADALGVDLDTAERAFRAEVAYYVEHHLDGSDPDGLRDLRDRCAAIVAGMTGADPATARDALLRSLKFEAFDDAAPTLALLRERGMRLVVVSNWDCSLRQVLDQIGLLGLVDEVVVSAVVGVAKPGRHIFDAALKAAGCAPGEALHVGDSVENDLMGAVAAGLRGILLDRSATPARPPAAGAVSSLEALPALLS
jgi:FMN phosphatase YigB (HAD superfamily)